VSPENMSDSNLIIIEYQDLLKDPSMIEGKISPLIEKAYGRSNNRAFGVSYDVSFWCLKPGRLR
jgi:hypothetical protein